jgi:hypothetical protein
LESLELLSQPGRVALAIAAGTALLAGFGAILIALRRRRRDGRSRCGPGAVVARSRVARRGRRLAATRFVRWVAEAPDGSLEGLDGLRGRLLAGAVFRLIPLQFDRRAGREMRVAVEWRLTEPDGGAPVRTLTIRDGHCRVRRGVVADPDLVVELSIADFLRLVAGVESGPALFSEGRLRVRGDAGLALRLPRVFRVPRAGRP